MLLQVGKGLCVKIADFGLSYDLHSEDYCRIGSRDSRPVPLRWLSPEAISHNSYSMFSDIWSYGVLLWEVFSLGERPYNHLSNAETVEYILRHKTLEKPKYCQDNVFGIMQSCWFVEPTKRKPFHQLSEDLEETVENLDISDISKRFSIRSPLTPDKRQQQREISPDDHDADPDTHHHDNDPDHDADDDFDLDADADPDADPYDDSTHT